MKRKFSESLQNFSQIQQKHSLNEFLKPIFYAYRGYGNFCLSNHSRALEDYKSLLEIKGSLDQGSNYNRLLCEGIINVQQGRHDKGIEYFARAGKTFSKRMEPLLYYGVSLINKAFHQESIKNVQEKVGLVLKGIYYIYI